MLTGLGTALITPFLPNGNIDFEALKRLLNKQIQGQVDYIVVLGTTGEAATLTVQERQQVRSFIVEHVAGRIPLVLGLGGNCTHQVLEDIETQREELIRDYAAILSVCPYYNKPSQEGLFRHFSAIAQASPIPVILYNVPGRTGVNLLPETVIRIWLEHPDKVIGIKEASGNMNQITQLIKLTQSFDCPDCKRLMVISGDDGIACDVIKAGGVGLISVAGNAWPTEFGRIVREQDSSMQAHFATMVQLLFKEGNPAGIKTVLRQQGLIHNKLRLPLVANSPTVQHEITTEMANL